VLKKISGNLTKGVSANPFFNSNPDRTERLRNMQVEKPISMRLHLHGTAKTLKPEEGEQASKREGEKGKEDGRRTGTEKEEPSTVRYFRACRDKENVPLTYLQSQVMIF